MGVVFRVSRDCCVALPSPPAPLPHAGFVVREEVLLVAVLKLWLVVPEMIEGEGARGEGAPQRGDVPLWSEEACKVKSKNDF